MQPSRRYRLRPLAAFVIVIAIVGVFVLRLVDVQVVEAAGIDHESRSRRTVDTVVPGTRGSITDANGVVLATSVPRYAITASPKLAAGPDLRHDAARIAKAAHLSTAVVQRTLTSDPTSQYAMLVPTATLAVLNAVKALDLPWLYYAEVDQRIYPNGAVAGNLTGFVGADGTAQAGIEYGENGCLKGTDGARTAEVAAGAGTVIPGTAVTTKKAQQGGTVKLTIDRDLQWFAQQVLASRAKKVGAKWGSVVVEEVSTGKLLAVADWPTVDPNDVAATADTDTGALGSRAFTAPYEPGSTMKSVTVAALLDEGKITTTTHVLAPNHWTDARGADVHDAETHGNWRLTTTGVLINSSNTGISQLGLRMSDADRYQYLLKFGFGSTTAVGFGAEASGDLGANAPKWDGQSEVATMFGQGLTSTAVQMTSAYATLAGGGVKRPVSLVESCTTAAGKVEKTAAAAPQRVVSKKAARDTIDMLENVATQGWLAPYVKIPGYRVGIKTGTAQESDGHGGYAKGYLVSVVGVAPAEAPKYVVYVDMDDAVKMNTTEATAPVFQKVMARVLQEHGVVPSGSTSPHLPENY